MFGSGLLDQGAASGKLMSGSSAYRRDGFQRHVAGALDGPLVILFEEQRADEADDGLAVWEDADDLGAALGVGSARPDHLFVEEIAAALRRAHGDSRAGAKTVAAWTGANEKTAKNWFSGTYGSSGAHLVALARHSEEGRILKPTNNRGHCVLPAICQPRRLKARAGATWENYRQTIYWSTFGRSLGC